MTIACLGWGSLVWNLGRLPVIAPWRSDGPFLPVEFARQSVNGRLTLVLTSDATPVPVLWAALDVSDMTKAIEALRIREETAKRRIGFWPSPGAAQEIEQFAALNKLSGVVWTALPPKFDGVDDVMPSKEEAVAYLSGLEGEKRNKAEEYIRRAPKQIATQYRKVFEEKLGWTATP